MDVTRIIELADFLDEQEPYFDQRQFFMRDEDLASNFDFPTRDSYVDVPTTYCSTPSCIAGHAIAKYRPDFLPQLRIAEYGTIVEPHGGPSFTITAGTLLDLTSSQRFDLFINYERHLTDRQCADPKVGAAALRHLAATGTVDWKEAVRKAGY